MRRRRHGALARGDVRAGAVRHDLPAPNSPSSSAARQTRSPRPSTRRSTERFLDRRCQAGARRELAPILCAAPREAIPRCREELTMVAHTRVEPGSDRIGPQAIVTPSCAIVPPRSCEVGHQGGLLRAKHLNWIRARGPRRAGTRHAVRITIDNTARVWRGDRPRHKHCREHALPREQQLRLRCLRQSREAAPGTGGRRCRQARYPRGLVGLRVGFRLRASGARGSMISCFAERR
jgi:hypothetical protein